MSERKDLDRPSAVERVLAEWFLLLEEGAQPELEALCGGDDELLALAERLLAKEPAILKRQAESTCLSAPPEDDELAGTRLADFRILNRIAAGGMGAVYLAVQEPLGRTVALKIVDRSLLATPHAWQRLRREAAIAASLDHPNIVPVYAVGEEGERCFIAMRHLSGPALSQLEGKLRPREAARIGMAIADALDFAHGCGVVHRDVKPANILLDGDTPYLVDFGLARSSVDPTLTGRGSVPGTLPYMAPELLSRDGIALDPRSDVYALGATLYELLTGAPPFVGRDPAVTVRKILLQEPAPLGLGRAHADLETVVRKALEKEPRHRIGSARALADDMRRYLAGEPIEARPTSRLYRLARRARRHPRVTVFTVASAAVITVLAVVTLLARVSERRVLEAGIQLVESELDRGYVHRAKATLEGLLADHERDGALAQIDERVEAEVATDLLFMKLYQRPLFAHGEELERACDAVRATGASELLPDRATSLLAMAEWSLGRKDAARERLAAMRAGGTSAWAAAAVAELVGESPEPFDPVEGGASADEHLLRALVRLLLGRPPAEQEAELRAALAGGAGEPRVLYARAASFAASGRYGRARDTLEALVAHGIDTPDALRLLVRVRIHGGDLEGARAVLSSIPEDAWGAAEAYLDLELLEKSGDRAAFESRLARYHECKAEWPDASLFDLAEAEYLHGEGEIEAADELYGMVEGHAIDPAVSDMAAAKRFWMHVDVAVRGATRGAPDQEALAILRDEGVELLETVRYPRARCVVAFKLAMVFLFAGPAERGFQLLEEAIDGMPGEVLPRIVYAEQCLEVLPHVRNLIEAGGLEAGTDEYLLARAQRTLAEAVRRLDQGEAFASVEHRSLLARWVVELALETSDWKLLVDAGPLFATVPRTPELERAVQRAQAAHERLYGEPNESLYQITYWK